MSKAERRIIHVDMDAFFAAVEQREDPSLRGKPVVVGGDPAGRGVVAAASYEARKWGIRSAMPAAEARRRCPQAIFLRPHFELYAEISRQVMGILHEFSPIVEQVSVDEAFMDVTGCEGLFGPAEEMARRIQERISAETRLSASLGVAPNRFLAKLASEREKPHGLVVVRQGQEAEFLRELPLEALWGVGEATAERLRRLGLRTVGELAEYPRDLLEQQFGEHGRRLHELAHGQDDTPVAPGGERKSVSAETTFARDTAEREFLERTLLELSEQVGRRVREKGLEAMTVTLKVRFADFSTITRRDTAKEPVSEDLAIYERALRLLQPQLRTGRKLRLLGVGVSNFAPAQQLRLLEEERPRRPVDEALDQVRRKFGTEAIRRGRLVDKQMPGREPEENSR